MFALNGPDTHGGEGMTAREGYSGPDAGQVEGGVYLMWQHLFAAHPAECKTPGVCSGLYTARAPPSLQEASSCQTACDGPTAPLSPNVRRPT